MYVALCFAADSANGEVSLAQTTALERISWGFEEHLCGKAFQLKPIRDLPTHHLKGLSQTFRVLYSYKELRTATAELHPTASNACDAGLFGTSDELLPATSSHLSR